LARFTHGNGKVGTKRLAQHERRGAPEMAEVLTEKLKETAEATPEQVAMFHDVSGAVREVTYGEIYSRSLKIAHWLCKIGVRKGDRVAVMMENRPEWSMCYFGILFCGAVAVPLDFQLSSEQVRYTLEKTRARAVFTSAKTVLSRIAEQKSVEHVVVTGEFDPAIEKTVPFDQVLATPEADCSLPRANPEDIASIIFTSGTTGPPKGVMLTHGNFYSNFISLSGIEQIRPDDNFLSILPLHHAFPFMVTLITPLFLRAGITYIDTLQMDAIRRSLRDRRITIVTATPQVLEYFHRSIEERIRNLPGSLEKAVKFLLNASWRVASRTGKNPAEPVLAKLRSGFAPHLRYLVSGGARLDEEVERAFLKLGFEVVVGYGLSETAPVVTMNPPEAPRIGSAGKPVKGVRVRIANPDEEGVGEVLIKGGNVMKGYYGDEEAGREALEDGWFHTGDLGVMDSEGYLFIRGRLKDIIVLSSGKNVSSEEVKEHYLKAPSIKEIHVMADPRAEKLTALIVPDFRALREFGISDVHAKVKRDLEQVSQSLESYKRVRDFVLTSEELPKTRLGKVERHKAERIYHEKKEGGESRGKPVAPEKISKIGQRVLEILSRETGSKNVQLSDHLELDLSLDSLTRVELMAALERGLAAKIDEERFNAIFTVEELIRYLEEIRPATLPEKEETRRSWDEILKEPPPAELVRDIGIHSSAGSRLITSLGSLIFDSLLGTAFRLESYGHEHLGERRYLICPNHASYLDGFAIFSSVSPSLRDRLFFMGFRPYFEVPVIRSLVRFMRIIPVESSRHLVEAMQASSLVLRSGKVLCIFPEGQASLTGKVEEFKKGVAILSRNLDVDVVPAYIDGSHDAWKPRTFLLKPHRIRVVFGKPCSSEELERTGRSMDPDANGYSAISLGLREEVLRLKRRLHLCETREASNVTGIAMDVCMRGI
jgi:long-chain acyl-CoA synthetase